MKNLIRASICKIRFVTVFSVDLDTFYCFLKAGKADHDEPRNRRGMHLKKVGGENVLQGCKMKLAGDHRRESRPRRRRIVIPCPPENNKRPGGCCSWDKKEET